MQENDATDINFELKVTIWIKIRFVVCMHVTEFPLFYFPSSHEMFKLFLKLKLS